MDNRVLNMMRQTMNEQIEDERGLMSIHDFKKMLYTSLGRIPVEQKNNIYDMLLTLISEPDDAVSQVQGQTPS